jgi:thiamine-phosphate pyrophosphorylase
MNKPVSGLYAITPEATDSIGLFEKVNAALRGGAQVVQYRAKFIPESLRLAQAEEIAGFCRSHNALFIVNDSIALARAVHADGIHIGQSDADVSLARDALGPGTLIGVSCYNDMTRARNAVSQGADYVAFGSFYASNTKPEALRASLGLLQVAAAQLSLPIVAIGGVNADNAQELISAGADAIAVLAALFDAPDIEAQAQRFVRLFQHPFISKHNL